MKKITRFLLLGLLIFNSSSLLFAQAASQGNVFVDLYYGGPNFGKSFANSLSDGVESENKITGLGPAGVRLEYMVGDNIGLGVDVIYNSLGLNYSYDSLNSDGSLYRTYTGKATMTRLRVQARFNFHFKISNPDLDAYFGVGAGSNSRFWSITSSNPDEYSGDDVKGSGALLPVSFRVCTGMRYFFTDNIGLNIEIGAGGPVISGGLSLRF